MKWIRFLAIFEKKKRLKKMFALCETSTEGNGQKDPSPSPQMTAMGLVLA